MLVYLVVSPSIENPKGLVISAKKEFNNAVEIEHGKSVGNMVKALV